MIIKCVVACRAADGTPTFFAVRVECTLAQYDEGDHYDQAEAEATDLAYEDPMLTYDENDGPEWLFAQFNWEETLLAHVAVEEEP